MAKISTHQKEINLLRRRIKYQLKKMSEDIDDLKLDYNVDKILSSYKKKRTKTLQSLKGSKLKKELEEREDILIEYKDKEKVPYSLHHKAVKGLKRVKEVQRRLGVNIDSSSPKYIKSKRGLNSYLDYVDRMSKIETYYDLGNLMLANLIQSQRVAYPEGSIGDVLLLEYFLKMNKIDRYNKLIELVDSQNFDPSYYFSSNQYIVRKQISKIFFSLGIPYDTEIDYDQPYKGDKFVKGVNVLSLKNYDDLRGIKV